MRVLFIISMSQPRNCQGGKRLRVADPVSSLYQENPDFDDDNVDAISDAIGDCRWPPQAGASLAQKGGPNRPGE